MLGSWTVLSLHVALSLLLIPLFLAHLGMRWSRPNRVDLLGRRAALRMLGLLGAGFVVWGAQWLTQVVLGVVFLLRENVSFRDIRAAEETGSRRS